MSSKKIISIEGNIGSGKSTLIDNLRKHFADNGKVVFIKEPVDEWETIRDVDGRTMLQLFYRNPTKYSFAFQMMAYISRLNCIRTTIAENPNATTFITERCLHTDKYVFAHMLWKEDKMLDVEHDIYNKWFNTFADEYPINQIIYVKTDPNICLNRIHIRSRDGEGSIPIEYLNDCHKHHEIMIDKHFPNTPKLILDGNNDIFKNTVLQQEWIEQITELIA